MRSEIFVLIILGYFCYTTSSQKGESGAANPGNKNKISDQGNPKLTAAPSNMDGTENQGGNQTKRTDQAGKNETGNPKKLTPIGNKVKKRINMVERRRKILRCYACASTGGNNECEDYSTYVKAIKGKGNEKVLKTCNTPHNDICFIETYALLGKTVSHIRGCRSSQPFSYFSNSNKTGYGRLDDLQPNNETACVWDNLHLVCLTKCDTDFCNGPDITEVNGAMVIKLSLVLIFVTSFAKKCFN